MNWHDYFTYNAATGDLVWKERPLSHFESEKSWKQWTSRWLGKVVGSERYKPDGRKAGIYTTLYGKCVACHNIVWEMHYGKMEPGYVPDHVDGNQFNNKLGNLRKATLEENGNNMRLRKDNSLRLKGVYRITDTAFSSQIQANSKSVYLGTFPTKGLAAVARAKAALRYHGKFARFT